MTVFALTWNSGFEGAPGDSQDFALGAARIREQRVAVRERMEIDHVWGGASDVDSGEHIRVLFTGPVSDPTTGANKGVVYTKDVAGKAELFWKDEDDNVMQITSVGALAGVSGADAATALTNVRNNWTEPQRGVISSPAFATTMSLDFNNGPDFKFTATNNFTLATPTNLAAAVNQKGSIKITQDGTGGRVISLSSVFDTPNNGEGITLTTTANSYDVIHYWVIDASTILIAATLDAA